MSIVQEIKKRLPVCTKQGFWLLLLIGPYIYYWDADERPFFLLGLCIAIPIMFGVMDAFVAAWLGETPHRYGETRRFLVIVAAMVGAFLVVQARLVTRSSPNQLWIFGVALFVFVALISGTATGADNANAGRFIRFSQILKFVGFALYGSFLTAWVYVLNPSVSRLTAALVSGLAVLCAGLAGIFLGSSLPPWIDELPKVMRNLRRMGSLLGAFIIGYVVIVFVFAGLYAAVWRHDHSSFNVGDNAHRGDFVYFSSVTASTLGYGDIVPCKPAARALACFQVAIAIGWITIVFAVVASLVQQRQGTLLSPREVP